MLFSIALNSRIQIFNNSMEGAEEKQCLGEVYIEMNLSGNPFIMQLAFFQYK